MSDDLTTILEAEDVPRMELNRVRLVGLTGPGCSVDCLLLDAPVVVGRDKGVELRLVDKAVSRRHAQIEPIDGRYRIKDLGSANGTFLDGSRIESAYLEDGNILRIGGSELRFEARRVHTGKSVDPELFPQVFGVSRVMRDVADLIRKVAPVGLPVLLQGESGTGKERFARAVHDHGPTPKGPYVVVDCTLLQGEHLRSELFGHVKGAFTGATSDRTGAFVDADGGTLFLDEVGELPLDLQPALLRALEAGDIRPLGGNTTRNVSVRVVSATHRDLKTLVAEGTFRQDLFYRLSAMTTRVPALRDRGSDVLLLAQKFLPEGVLLSEDARRALLRYNWPGNVRELRNTLQRATALADRSVVRVQDLGLDLGEFGGELTAPEMTLESIEVMAIRKALADCNGNKKEAAKQLGIARSTFYSKLQKLGIE